MQTYEQMTVTFVTAIYDIHMSRSAEIWDRFALLCKTIPVIIVCSASDASKIPAGTTPLFCEYSDLTMFEILEPFDSLPRVRCADKDTKEYMTIMNSKAEFLSRVKAVVKSDHYVWIDAGISKIFVNIEDMFKKILEQTEIPMRTDAILIPGCWPYKESDIAKLVEKIHWRFCGGFFIVPHDYVDSFYKEVVDGCNTIGAETGCVTWEVNVWAYIEPRLPILWAKGDHNESITDCMQHYWVANRAP